MSHAQHCEELLQHGIVAWRRRRKELLQVSMDQGHLGEAKQRPRAHNIHNAAIRSHSLSKYFLTLPLGHCRTL